MNSVPSRSFRPLAGINCNSKPCWQITKIFRKKQKAAHYTYIIPRFSRKEKNFLKKVAFRWCEPMISRPIERSKSFSRQAIGITENTSIMILVWMSMNIWATMVCWYQAWSPVLAEMPCLGGGFILFVFYVRDCFILWTKQSVWGSIYIQVQSRGVLLWSTKNNMVTRLIPKA